jgi:uncharacterized YigZ family protein
VNIVLKPCETEQLIKKSRFIGLLYPCDSETQAIGLLKQCHAQHPNATHIVYAYRIQATDGLICRFHDAGEPGGTAGKPMFAHLEGRQLQNALAVAIRYFGGVKLGAGGLTRAYGNLAKALLTEAEITAYIAYSELQITLDYPRLQSLEYQLNKLEGCILEQIFTEKVQLRIKIPDKHLQSLTDFLA